MNLGGGIRKLQTPGGGGRGGGGRRRGGCGKQRRGVLEEKVPKSVAFYSVRGRGRPFRVAFGASTCTLIGNLQQLSINANPAAHPTNPPPPRAIRLLIFLPTLSRGQSDY